MLRMNVIRACAVILMGLAGSVTLPAQVIDLGGLKNLGVNDLRLIRPNGLAQSVQGQAGLSLAPGQLLVGATPDWPRLSRQEDLKSRFELPYVIKVASGTTVLDLKAIVDIEAGGLRYFPSDKRFRGSLAIGVINTGATGSVVRLPQAISFFISSDADKTDPSQVSGINTTFDMRRISFEAIAPGEVVHVRIRPSFDQARVVQCEVEVIRGQLSLGVSPEWINGLGLQAANVTVRADGVPDPQMLKVTTGASLGSLAGEVTLDQSGVGTTELRSAGIGSAKLNASSPPGMREAAPLTVRFVFPWAFLASAVMGGLLGSGIRLWTARKKPAGAKSILLGLGLGIVIGIVGAAAYAVKVNLLGATFSMSLSGAEEALTFVIAGIFGYVGKLIIPT